MKKNIRNLIFSFICVFCLISTLGCSCSKTMSAHYEIKISNEKEGDTKETKISISTVIVKKFREPVGTPCYKKVGDKYELITHDEGIYECYDAEGNYFERATYNREEKIDLAKENPIINSSTKTYVSNEQDIPENEMHSLIYTFTIENNERKTIYIKEFGRDEILNNAIKEKSLNKVTVTMPYDNLYLDENNNEYYRIDKNSSIVIKVELKGLKVKDSENGKTKDLTINLPIVIK